MVLGGAAGLYEGAIASEERWQKRRADNRRAFMEFQRMMPNATLSDYQQFVDRLADGNTFLRGGLPADQALRRMAEMNQQKQAEQRLSHQLATLNQRAQVAGNIDALTSNFALDIEDDEKVFGAVAGALGYDPSNPATETILDTVRRQYPSGLSGLRTRQRQKIFQENVPLIQDVIKNNPNLTDEQVMSLVPGLSGFSDSPVRKSLLSEMLTSARTEVQNAEEKRRRELVDEAVKDARTQIDASGSYTLPNLDPELEADVHRQVEPYAQADQERRDKENKLAARRAMNEAASIYINTPGYVERLITDPAQQAVFKDQLRRAATQHGHAADDADVEAILQRVLEAGRTNSIETQKSELDDYKKSLSDYIGQEGVAVDKVPLPPPLRDKKLAGEATEAFRRFSTLLHNRNEKAEAASFDEVISSATNQLTANENLVDRVVRQDISPDELREAIVNEIALHTTDQPTEEMLRQVATGLMSHVENIRSSEFGSRVKSDIDKFEMARAEAIEIAKTSLNGIIDAKTLDRDGNPTLATQALKGLVNQQLFGPGSNLYPTPQAIGILEQFLTTEFVEEYGGNTFAMAQAIMANEDFVSAASGRDSVLSVNVGYPYGNTRGSKDAMLTGMRTAIDTTMQRTMSAVHQALEQLTAKTMSSEQFSDVISRANRRVEMEVQSTIATLNRIRPTSADWSTDGPITSGDFNQIVSAIQERANEALRHIEEQKQKGLSIIKGQGYRPEDDLIGNEPRVMSTGKRRRKARTGR